MIDCETGKILTPTKLLYIYEFIYPLKVRIAVIIILIARKNKREHEGRLFFFDRTVRATYRCKMD